MTRVSSDTLHPVSALVPPAMWVVTVIEPFASAAKHFFHGDDRLIIAMDRVYRFDHLVQLILIPWNEE